MARHPIRRAQLIAPFGVGGMVTFADGVSLMVAGLDHWYGEPAPGRITDTDEYIVEEWRLEHRLGVDHFRLPPDHRESWRNAEGTPNTDLKVPALRFPKTNVCQQCNTLHDIGMTERGRKRCPTCESLDRWAPLVQVQFVAACERGHLQDFPFREWVHRDVAPVCALRMRLYGASGSSLVAVTVECECGARRNMAGVTEVQNDETVLSHRTSKTGVLSCAGHRPWLGGYADEPCGLDLRGALRSATNTYFATTTSSVYVPRERSGVPTELMATLEGPPVSTWLRTLRGVGVTPTAEQLRAKFPTAVPDGVSDDVLTAAMTGDDTTGGPVGDAPTSEDDFRVLEYRAFERGMDEKHLIVRAADLREYAGWLGEALAGVHLVDRLRVTTAFTGFTRLVPSADFPDRDSVREAEPNLWAGDPPRPENWLPASLVYGEGIFLRFDIDRLRAWSTDPSVAGRAATLESRINELREGRNQLPREVPPELAAIHTLGHAVITALSFEAGYAAASLAERLYVSRDRAMAGLLVYTAAGDSDGTLGGLVRLGRPGHLERILSHAIDRARWCSSDPVCTELGDASGQGPSSCNLAACHDCSLLPETSCEEFNLILDRQLLVSMFDHA